jgi:hypothetical protein
MGDVPSLDGQAIARQAVRMGIEWSVVVEWVDPSSDLWGTPGHVASALHFPQTCTHVIALSARPELTNDPAELHFTIRHELVHCLDWEVGRYADGAYEADKWNIERDVDRRAALLT